MLSYQDDRKVRKKKSCSIMGNHALWLIRLCCRTYLGNCTSETLQTSLFFSFFFFSESLKLGEEFEASCMSIGAA